MATGEPGKDPGWGGIGAVLLGALLPWRAVSAAREGATPLVLLRTNYLAFLTAVVAFGITSAFVVDEVEDPILSTGAAVGGVLAIGIVLQVVAMQIAGELRCGTEADVVEQYRTRHFLRIALANAPVLLGVTSSYIVGSLAPYLASLVPAAIGYLRAAPTRANLERDQAALDAQGCNQRLLALLAP